jgi:hypothetical protein
VESFNFEDGRVLPVFPEPSMLGDAAVKTYTKPSLPEEKDTMHIHLRLTVPAVAAFVAFSGGAFASTPCPAIANLHEEAVAVSDPSGGFFGQEGVLTDEYDTLDGSTHYCVYQFGTQGFTDPDGTGITDNPIYAAFDNVNGFCTQGNPGSFICRSGFPVRSTIINCPAVGFNDLSLGNIDPFGPDLSLSAWPPSTSAVYASGPDFESAEWFSGYGVIDCFYSAMVVMGYPN